MSNVAVVTGASPGFGEELARCPGSTGAGFFAAARSDRFRVGAVTNVEESVERAGKTRPRPSSPPSLTIGPQCGINALGARLVPRRIVLAIAARTPAGPQNA